MYNLDFTVSFLVRGLLVPCWWLTTSRLWNLQSSIAFLSFLERCFKDRFEWAVVAQVVPQAEHTKADQLQENDMIRSQSQYYHHPRPMSWVHDSSGIFSYSIYCLCHSHQKCHQQYPGLYQISVQLFRRSNRKFLRSWQLNAISERDYQFQAGWKPRTGFGVAPFLSRTLIRWLEDSKIQGSSISDMHEQHMVA